VSNYWKKLWKAKEMILERISTSICNKNIPLASYVAVQQMADVFNKRWGESVGDPC
jgi:hypothetical protein